MSWQTLGDFKDHLERAGFDKKAILSDEEMANVNRILDRDERARDTPPEELRYIEGLFNLPLGHIRSFKIIPKPGHENCSSCGRAASALDIVYFAFSKQIHSRELIRDTLIGSSNIFEISEEGRDGECYRCGERMSSEAYWKVGYGYAAL